MNGQHLCTGRRTTSKVGRTEMYQPPLLPGFWIRRPFQRDCEPHGQNGSDASKWVSLAARNKGSTQETYNPYALHAQGGCGQPRTVIIQVDSILTGMKVVDQDPGASGLMVTKRSGNRDRTFIRLKESWMYVCMATITKKYIVASEIIVRTNAENLSVVLLRYVYQATARNADSSTCIPRLAIEIVSANQTSAATNQKQCLMNSKSTGAGAPQQPHTY